MRTVADVVHSLSPRSVFITKIVCLYLFFASLWIIFSDQLLTIFVDPSKFILLASLKGLAFVAVTTVLLVLALCSVPPASLSPAAIRPNGSMIAIGLVVVIAVGTGTVLVSQAALGQLQHDAGIKLTGIARTKAEIIARWIAERRADVRTLGNSALFADTVRRWSANPYAADAASIADVLTRWDDREGFAGVRLMDATGERLMGSNRASTTDPVIAAAVRRIIGTDEVALVDLKGAGQEAPYLSLVTSVKLIQNGSRVDHAALVFDLDPRVVIFPMLSSWPLPTQSGEFLLIQQEGDNVVILNKASPSEPGKYGVLSRIPPELISRDYSFEGFRPPRLYEDYRGKVVLGVRVPVPGTPWAIVAKEDISEALGPGRRVVLATASLAIALTLALLAGGYVLAQRRRLAIALAEVVRTRAQLTVDGRFQASFEHVAFGMGHVALDGTFLRVNERLAAMFGVPREQLVGRTAIEFLPGPYRAEFLDLRSRLFAGEISSFTHERTHVRPDGSMLNLSLTASLAPAQGDDPPYMVGVTQDISARRAAETALRCSEERWRRMFEVTPLAIIVLADHGDQILQANPAACSMLGYSHEALMGLRWADLQHPDDQAFFMPAGTEPPVPVEICLVGQRGRPIQVRAAHAHFSTPDEQQPLTIIVAEDITVLRETEKKLQHMQRMEVLGQLAGGLAHDFNNLLSVIVLEAELLMRNPDSTTVQAGSEILNTALRGSELTRRLLIFARQKSQISQSVDLHEFMRDELQLLRRSLTGVVSVIFDVSAEVWPVQTDPSGLQNALLNLAINARDAMPAGGTLTMTAANHMLDDRLAAELGIQAGPYVRLSVTDTGIGMAPEVVEHAMEPFFTTKPLGAGTGLGLAMVCDFVRKSQGHIAITSTLGKGTTVELLFPRAIAVAGPSVCDIGSPRAGHGHILIVDDNQALGKAIGRQLQILGYTVQIAEDGPTALQILRNDNKFDLLFTDQMMPGGLVGTELARQAKILCPQLKILITTGVSGESLDTDMPILLKPYRLADLAQQIQRLL